jgi:hypothetical protein
MYIQAGIPREATTLGNVLALGSIDEYEAVSVKRAQSIDKTIVGPAHSDAVESTPGDALLKRLARCSIELVRSVEFVFVIVGWISLWALTLLSPGMRRLGR